MKRRHTYRYIYQDLDIATLWKNWPKGRFFENIFFFMLGALVLGIFTLFVSTPAFFGGFWIDVLLILLLLWKEKIIYIDLLDWFWYCCYYAQTKAGSVIVFMEYFFMNCLIVLYRNRWYIFRITFLKKFSLVISHDLIVSVQKILMFQHVIIYYFLQ